MIRHADKADEPRLRELWEICFPGEPDFTELFFNRMFRNEYALKKECDGHIAAMLHAFPYYLHMPDGMLKTYYIYGVGCDPEYRGRGFAGELLNEVYTQAHDMDLDLCMLIPQNEGLFSFYLRHGYEPRFFIDIEKRDVLDSRTSALRMRPAALADISVINSIYEGKLNSYIYAKRDPVHWEMLLDECEGIRVFERDNEISGYAVYYKKEKKLYIIEIFMKNDSELFDMQNSLANLLGCETVQITRPGTKIKIGAVRLLSGKAKRAFADNAPAYLNLMHN